PARAPDDRSRPASGIFTEPDVMLTMRPNLRRLIGSITFWISSIATTMLATTPSIICWRVSSRKSRNGGPALLLIRMSGSGQAASSAFWPSGAATSAVTGMILAPVALAISAAAASSFLASRPLITTSQPASASARAQALPSPRLDAQTMALRPAIPRSMGVPRFLSARVLVEGGWGVKATVHQRRSDVPPGGGGSSPKAAGWGDSFGVRTRPMPIMLQQTRLGCRRTIERGVNNFHYAFDVLADIVVPDANDSVTFSVANATKHPVPEPLKRRRLPRLARFRRQRKDAA